MWEQAFQAFWLWGAGGIIDGDEEEETGNATESAQPERQDGDSTEPVEENPQNGQA